MQPSRKLLSVLSAILGAGIISAPLLAFSHPLSSTAIREAYFLGSRQDVQTAEFLSHYVHSLPPPQEGPYVNEIGIDTPFTQIVRRSERNLNYNAPDAVEEFQHKRMTVCVYVDIALTPTYSPVPEASSSSFYAWVPDFWNDFKVKMIQDGQVVAAGHRRGGPFYGYGGHENPIVTGARIELDYDPSQVAADSTTIEVLTPDGQTIQTTFDLGKLR